MSTHFIIGGARSGKSRLAERLAAQQALPVTVIVTAQALDQEMRERIVRHQQDRPPQWATIESPLLLADALAAQVAENHFVIVDCLTLWLSNWLMQLQEGETLAGNDTFCRQRNQLLSLSQQFDGELVLVANEVGLSLVPETPLGRTFRDEAGFLHQQLAAVADRVSFMVAGLPINLKG